MDLQASGFIFLIFLSCTFGIQLKGNGYTDVLIAINPAVREESVGPNFNQKIEDMLKDASKYLYDAAGKRFFFKEVTILVPSHWTRQTHYKNVKAERYDKANVIIDLPNGAYGDEPYTLQYGQCGEEGQYIHLTPNFLLDDKLIDVYGDRGRVFVHEWAHLRWGVYDEYSDEQRFYWSSNGKVEPTRCSKKIDGKQCKSRDQCDRCDLDPKTGLPSSDCMFLPNKSPSARESIMAFPSVPNVVEFCSTETHNAEAPNRQNQMCGNRAVMDVILNSSVDAGTQASQDPFNPPLTIRFVQRKSRVVCLTLDVSGSMGGGDRIMRLRQAASLFLRDIIEDTAYVAIVQFESVATTLKKLTEISNQTREELVRALPTRASGGTAICRGITKALEEIRQDDGVAHGDEIVLLSDGESSDFGCLDDVYNSSVTVHTIALGPSADPRLGLLANKTGGISFYAGDKLDSNELIDVFASLTTSDGNLTNQAIQLESSGKTTTDWFNGTFSVDKTVGTGTVVTVVYQAIPPTIFIESPSGESFNQSHFDHDPSARTLNLRIPGTAKVGEWRYKLLNTGINAQSMAITVTSRAVSADVPPITVKTHMSQKSSDGSKAMVVYAVVTQKGLPVILANVTATLESDKGHVEMLQLEDNGAGADAFRNDGIYSRYFTNMTRGRYNLKVRVKNKDTAKISTHKHSGAPYIPGYVVDGQVQMNPPKPPVSYQPVEVGDFSRTVTGESFLVDVPPDFIPSFPPSKITDLKAKIEGDSITLTWTAPGESYDEGTASLYHIHWSKDLESLKKDFEQANAVNTSGLSPQEAGFTEEYSFPSSNFNITNGTQVFFAITAENAKSDKSEKSNIVQVVKFERAPEPEPGPGPEPKPEKGGLNINVIIIAVSSAVAAIGILIVAIACIK